MTGQKHFVGDWRGVYFYDTEPQRRPDGSGVGFELHLRQSWLQGLIGWFSGTVTDDPEQGMPGVGRIGGTLRGASIRFTKQMPVAYLASEGGLISVRDWLRKKGHDPGCDVPHSPIFYRGTFSDSESASGTWRIAGRPLHVNARLCIPTRESTGTWTLTR